MKFKNDGGYGDYWKHCQISLQYHILNEEQRKELKMTGPENDQYRIF